MKVFSPLLLLLLLVLPNCFLGLRATHSSQTQQKKKDGPATRRALSYDSLEDDLQLDDSLSLPISSS